MQILASLFLFGLILGFFALWLYALISAIKNERLDPNMRVVWVIVIVFVNLIGGLLYLLIAPNRPTAEERWLADGVRRRERLRSATQLPPRATDPSR